MKVKIWGARGSIPAPITPEAIRDKIIAALLGISKLEPGELREELISIILESPEHHVADMSSPGIYETVYEKIQAKRRQAIEKYLDALSPLSVSTAGGNTPCIEVRSGDDLFIIDAGSGIRELGQALMQGPCGKGEGLIRLFFSHPHWDHIQGFPFFRPAFIPGNKIYIYSVHDIEAALRRQQEAISFPVSLDYMQATMTFNRIKPGDILEFGDLRIQLIRNEHPGDAYSFRFEKGNKAFVYASDASYPTGLQIAPHLNFFHDADVLIFDAQFTQRESDEKEDWGHSSSFVGVEMAQEADVKNLVLFHYDPTYSDLELEEILERTLKFQSSQYPTKPPVKVMVAQEGQVFSLTPEQTTQVQQIPGSQAAILQPSGIFDERVVVELRDQLAEVAQTALPPQLIIDMSNVELLQVVGLRGLVKLRKDYQEKGTLMALANPSISVQQLIELAGYLDFFAIYPSVREALKALEARETLNLPGQILKSRYRIEDKIGEGRLGTVFKAIDTQQNIPVAIKILSPSFSEGAIEQFLRQARQIIDLVHPNIVDVYDCAEDRGIAFMAEEFIESRTLRDMLDEHSGQPLPFDIALSIAESITRGLEYAHNSGVIHGDLKPKNVLLADEVKISDFGLGRLESGRPLINIDVRLTLMTARYLAPEQVLGHPIDARTDLYALGVILYEMFTGQPPFEGSDQELLEYHRTLSPTPPRELNPNLSRSLEHLILKLLDKDPTKRYAKARQVQHILNSMSTPISGQAQARTFAVEQWPPLVGRQAELAQLTNLWAETQQGRGQVVFINGEPGVGKTRLMQELIYCLDEATVLIGVCPKLERGVIYGPFVSALTTYFENVSPETAQAYLGQFWTQLTELIPEVSLLIPQDITGDMLLANDAQNRQAPALQPNLLARLLSQATAEQPWLLVLDDWQWADDSSLKLLDYLARHCRHLPLMIICLYGPQDIRQDALWGVTLNNLQQLAHSTTIALKELTINEVKELLESLWAQSAPKDLVSAIFNCTRGNPLYVEEIAKGLIDEGVVNWRDNKWYFSAVVESSLPKDIDQAIQRRINHLSRETQTFLSQAAVFDPLVKFDDLHEMSDLSEWDALESVDICLERQFLLEAPGEKVLHFSHSKIQEALYDGLSSLRRRLMHREAGEALERRYPGEPKQAAHSLAHHFLEAGELEKGLVYSIQAAAHAEAIYANHNALHWYIRALNAINQLGMHSPTQEQRFELLLACERIHYEQGRRQTQLADLEALQDLARAADDPARQAQVFNLRAAYAHLLNKIDEATDTAQAGLEAARQAKEPLLESESQIQLAYLAMRQGQFNIAREYLHSAQARLEQANNRRVEIKSLLALGALYKHLNRYADSQMYDQQALEISRAVGDRNGQAGALKSLARTFLAKGDYSQAQAYGQEALIIYQFTGNRRGEAACLNTLAAIYTELGCVDLARRYVDQALTLYQTFEDESGIAEAFQILGAIELTLENFAGTRDHVGQALEIYQHSKNRIHEGGAWLTLALALEGLGDMVKAKHAYEQSQNIMDSTSNSVSALDAKMGLARCLLTGGQDDRARQAVEAIVEQPDPHDTWAMKYPIRFYLSAYKILSTAQNPQLAQIALEKGQMLLQDRANGLNDPELKASLLNNVPENRALLQLEQHPVKATTG
jgi:anti-anti-sigma factor